MVVARVGQAAPEFSIEYVAAAETVPQAVSLSDYRGSWVALIFYPRDFTFVCPTELTAFSGRVVDFRRRNCELLGISADSIELHREWLAAAPENGGLGRLQFPLGSDLGGAAARRFGVWDAERGVSLLGLFLIDPEGILQYAVVHSLNVGRSPDEVLRVLEALQTGGLCPASWTSADGTIDPDRALRPGMIVGHYRIRRKLGEGTFGTVFAAQDLRLERTVALKILKQSVADSREALLIESRAAAALNDPHVCTIYAVEEEDGLPLIAMEFVDGRPLSQLIAEKIAPDAALKLAAQIAAGVAAAHDKGLVHGDLKPANVLVTAAGQAKVLDFGLARSQKQAVSLVPDRERSRPSVSSREVAVAIGDTDATMPLPPRGSSDDEGIRGSLAYMSPEQLMGQPATSASDVFALGLVWFEMLSGERALAERSPAELIARLQRPTLGEELAARVDSRYRRLIRSILASDPSRRPALQQVVRELAELTASGMSSASRESSAPPRL